MNNIHRITGTIFQHAKPNLCPTCAHRRDYGEWEGFCAARNKILSAPQNPDAKSRCSDYRPTIEAANGRPAHAELILDHMLQYDIVPYEYLPSVNHPDLAEVDAYDIVTLWEKFREGLDGDDGLPVWYSEADRRYMVTHVKQILLGQPSDSPESLE